MNEPLLERAIKQPDDPEIFAEFKEGLQKFLGKEVSDQYAKNYLTLKSFSIKGR